MFQCVLEPPFETPRKRGSSGRGLALKRSPQAASAITFIETIESGSRTGSPRLILSTFSMPSTTSPQTVYCLSRKRASSKTMKNWLLAEFGFWAAGHRADAAHMRLGVELGLQVRIARAAGAGAVRAADLRHEAVDDAMEDDAVIEALAGEQLDALDMAGSEIGTQLDDDAALGGFHDEGVLGIERHQLCLSLDGARPWKRMVKGRPAILAPRPFDNLIGVQERMAATADSVKRFWKSAIAAPRLPGHARLAEQAAVAAQAEADRGHRARQVARQRRRAPAAPQRRRDLGRAGRLLGRSSGGVSGETEPMRPISPPPCVGRGGPDRRCSCREYRLAAERPADAGHCSAGRSAAAGSGSASPKAAAAPDSASRTAAAGRDRAYPAPSAAPAPRTRRRGCRSGPPAASPRPSPAASYLASDCSRMRTILSGPVTWPLPCAPFLILRTASMPETTSPNSVYWPVSGPQPS